MLWALLFGIMNAAEIEQIAIEISEAMSDRQFGKIFPLSESSFAIDFHPHAGRYLFIDHAARTASAFLIVRRLKELERSTVHSGNFVVNLRKTLAGRKLTEVRSDGASIRLFLAGEVDVLSLVIQLRTAPNVFLLGADAAILQTARRSDRNGQQVGEIYAAPEPQATSVTASLDLDGQTLSQKMDSDRREYDKEARSDRLASEARKKIKGELAKRRKLLVNLDSDLVHHGNADQWKKYGDLILANLSNLKREGDSIFVTDFFDPDLGKLEIPADRERSPNEVAESYFRKYTKARNAVASIAKRKEDVNMEIEEIVQRQNDLESSIAANDEETLNAFIGNKPVDQQISKEKKKADEFTGARRFVTSQGFEILVGKKAKDNDHLTFRIAKPYDTWLHAADYPGSHVIVRNPSRGEIPSQTLIDAARLAGFYSDARENPKIAVNYTLKKFVNKPKRSAPGLASLSSFKTIMVVSGFPDTVEKA
ncbi:MAG: NFACT RNA binding domain-containing protein [Pyrinomonadaceae bacterium]